MKTRLGCSSRAIVSLVLLISPLALGAHAQQLDSVALAGPGTFISSYATPIVVVTRDGSLTFENFDLTLHNLRHDLRPNSLSAANITPDPAPTMSTEPWCFDSHGNVIDPLPGVAGCPRFWSDSISTAGQTPVEGIANLESGQIYPFYCTIHPNVRGYLVVQ